MCHCFQALEWPQKLKNEHTQIVSVWSNHLTNCIFNTVSISRSRASTSKGFCKQPLNPLCTSCSCLAIVRATPVKTIDGMLLLKCWSNDSEVPSPNFKSQSTRQVGAASVVTAVLPVWVLLPEPRSPQNRATYRRANGERYRYPPQEANKVLVISCCKLA